MASRDPLGSHRLEDAMVAGQVAMEESRFEEATNYFKSALRFGPRSSEEEAQIRCYLSESLEKRGLYHEQLSVISKYDNFPEFVRLSERTQMIVLTHLGWAYSFNNDIPRAIALFNQGMRIARRLDDQQGIGACYFGMARAYRFVSEIRIARDHYISALEYFRRVGSWRELAECYFSIGNIDAREGEYRTAIQPIKQALAIVGDRKEYDLLGRAHSDLALIYDNSELGIAKALDCWERAIEYFRSSGNTIWLAVNYNNLANKLVLTGEWDRAEAMVREAIELLRGTTRVTHLGGALDTLAHLYMLQGKLDEADQLLEESLQAFAVIKNDKQPLSREMPHESSTRTTIGRVHLLRGNFDPAIAQFERAVDIAVRLGDRQYLPDAQLWLAEAQLQIGRIEQARSIIEAVRSYQRESPDMLAWGLMMRVDAKIGAATGHIAAAIQSLGQSTSIFEIKGNVYDLAVNRIVLVGMLEKQGRFSEAISESEAALAVFRRLGAAIDERVTAAYVASLKQQCDRAGVLNINTEAAQLNKQASPNLASVLDGFIAQRLVQASVSRLLLIQELASVARSQANSRAAIVAEIISDDPMPEKAAIKVKIAASVGLPDAEQNTVVEFLSRLSPQDYPRHFVYRFSDKQQSDFLLYLIDPKSDRFRVATVNLEPLLCLVEQGLETHLLKSKTRRTKIFTPTRLLTEVELPGFICASRAMTRVLEQIHKIRSSDVTVLITGESGTGKELIARAVHAGSSRRFNVFLPFNCSAAPREMIESQLFGFRKGSFTGAIASNEGIIRAAERGTLFLDEIGDLPVDLQPKLLRFLQEGEIHPLGDSQPLHVDVRAIAATNADLEQAVAEGKFREDLFHRLNVIRIQVPPLRERREEIPTLINHYLNLYQKEAAKTEIQLSEEAVDLMVVYDWPGNVRQLCNEIRRIVAYTESSAVVTPESLSPEIVRASQEIQPPHHASKKPAETGATPVGEMTLSEAVEELERRMIQEALRRSSGNIARAAKELGLSRKGLYLKMDRLDFRI